ncbi:YlxQ family RNA-binding protein [Tuberibacillus sp. Marseille-P3662]|uniref:YlxQ family RNA-binding protein n=1 Tax=Tuberibacillus sp. Marseille-P3662 TaxID=1965358 RepID=UPI000A1CBCF9|nr:YlxQ family RNA-binding protein [Tuberibacillus sp. Marseille-P3662]
MADRNQSFFSLLGLAYRARKLISGEEIVINAIRNNQVKLVIVAGDASERTAKTMTDKTSHYRVPMLRVSDRYHLGRAIGKPERVIVGLTDKGFSDKLLSLSDQSFRG